MLMTSTRRHWRFTIASLLICTAVAAVACEWWRRGEPARLDAKEQAAFEELILVHGIRPIHYYAQRDPRLRLPVARPSNPRLCGPHLALTASTYTQSQLDCIASPLCDIRPSPQYRYFAVYIPNELYQDGKSKRLIEQNVPQCAVYASSRTPL